VVGEQCPSVITSLSNYKESYQIGKDRNFQTVSQYSLHKYDPITDFQMYSYMKIMHTDVKYILLFIG